MSKVILRGIVELLNLIMAIPFGVIYFLVKTIAMTIKLLVNRDVQMWTSFFSATWIFVGITVKNELHWIKTGNTLTDYDEFVEDALW